MDPIIMTIPTINNVVVTQGVDSNQHHPIMAKEAIERNQQQHHYRPEGEDEEENREAEDERLHSAIDDVERGNSHTGLFEEPAAAAPDPLADVIDLTSIPNSLPSSFTLPGAPSSIMDVDDIDEEQQQGLPLMVAQPHSIRRHQSNDNNMSPTATNLTSSSSEAEFLAAVRFSIYIGKAAFRYGSPGSKVEVFLQRLLEDRFGYWLGMFRATQSELMCSVCQAEDDVPRTFLVALEPGLNLHKLGLLAELVDHVVAPPSTGRNSSGEQPGSAPPALISRTEAIEFLKIIEVAPDPWGKLAVASSFPIVGAGLSMVLGGSWWDVTVGFLLGIVAYATIEVLPKLGKGKRFAQWVPFVSSFCVSTLATIVNRTWLPGLHVTLVTLSAIAVLLPGYTVSMGIGELVSNRIIDGAANLIGGMVTMFWLVVGAWLGDALGASITQDGMVDDDTAYSSDPVPMPWQALFVPLLCFSLIAAFQVSHRDMWWCLLHLLLTYLIFLITGFVLEWTHQDDKAASTSTDTASSVLAAGGKNLRTYLSTVVSCVAANFWASRTNRPNSILLVPALVFLVSGSIGFQGLLTILTEDDQEDKSTGREQFLQMIIVALLIVAGLLTGNTLLEPSTTL